MPGNRIDIPVTQPYFNNEEAEALRDVLQSGWVSQGPRVAQFEEACARCVGTQWAVATSSCTAALHLALVALGVKEADEVLVPAFTFVATINAIEYCRARPVFIDIDLATFNMDVNQMDSKITKRTQAIIPVHLFGLSAQMDPILELAKKHHLLIIEDAACALGARYKEHPVGTFGQAGCFSFHPRKIITTGEGGLIATDDTGLAKRLRCLRSHGAESSDFERHRGKKEFLLPAFNELGFNYRMTDLQAAVGLKQLDKLDEILQRRIYLAQRYTEGLGEIRGLHVPLTPPGWIHSFQSYVVLIDEDASCSRDTIATQLALEGIATRQGTHAVHALGYYRTRYGLHPEDYPCSLRADRQTLTLPLYPSMKPSDQSFVIERLRALLCG